MGKRTVRQSSSPSMPVLRGSASCSLLCRARSTNAQSPYGSPIVLEQSEAQPDRRPTDRCVALSKRSSSNPICGVGPDDGTNVLHRELTDNSPQRRPTRPTMPIRYVEARRGAMGARDIWILQLCRHTHRFRPVPSHTTVGNTGSARVATCRACTVCRLEARRLTGMQRSTAGTGEKSTVC